MEVLYDMSYLIVALMPYMLFALVLGLIVGWFGVEKL